MPSKKKIFYLFGRSGLRLGVVILIVISLYFLNLTPVSKNIKNLFYSASQPIQKWLWRQGTGWSQFAQSIFNSQNLKKENEKLKLENQQLIGRAIEIEKLRKENEDLKTLLSLGAEKEFTLATAQLIGKEISKDYLIINKGTADNIEFGSPVITAHRVLVGRISQIYESISKVQLSTSKDISFDVKVLGRETYGLAKGGGDFTIGIEHVPQQEEVKVGDYLITSALGGNFPEGLLVGEVKEVIRSDIVAFQEIKVVPAFELGGLDNLFIITDF